MLALAALLLAVSAVAQPLAASAPSPLSTSSYIPDIPSVLALPQPSRLLWALSLANAFTAYYCLDGGNAWDFTSGNGELYMLNPGCSPANSAAPGFCTAPATLVGRYYQQALPILLVLPDGSKSYSFTTLPTAATPATTLRTAILNRTAPGAAGAGNLAWLAYSVTRASPPAALAAAAPAPAPGLATATAAATATAPAVAAEQAPATAPAATAAAPAAAPTAVDLRMVRYLQRVSTVGGLAPTRPCTQGEFVTSPYSAIVLLYG